MMKKSVFMLLIMSTLFSACQKDLTTTVKDSKWVLNEWPGKTMPDNAKATLNFADGSRISGKAFCNSYGGNVIINGNAVQFSKMFSTKMFCQDLAESEDIYLAEIAKVTAGKISGSKLYLYEGEKLLMIFTKMN